MEVVLVPTTHWDREWYRTFQAFRARLVDTIDRVLELLGADPGYKFLLDGQTIVLEDYVEIRPGRRAELEGYIRDGRIEIGPWYVQPDSLLPSGEAHIRNLLEGRRAGEAFGPVSRVAYTPDSFGHPAQFPQLFAGFGLGHFVYWRGNGNEIAELPVEYRWKAPDGSEIVACHLAKGYGNAAGLPSDVDAAVERLHKTVDVLAQRTMTDRVLLLAGTDHQPPDARTERICEALAAAAGAKVRRGLLADFVDGLEPDDRPPFTGELVGGRVANLLPAVWSTRTYLKLRNRRCETALDGWAEPWTAFGGMVGTPDERPALRLAWRQLLQNQAHDSICGCSQDAVHDQMLARYDAAEEIARETTVRTCERIAGLGTERRTPWSDAIDVAVFNPSPHMRTDVVRFPLQGYPPFDEAEGHFIHPLVWANMRPDGFEVDGRPARLVPVQTHDRVRIISGQQDWDVEFVASDIPAFGYRRLRLAPSAEHPETSDDGRSISADDISVDAADDGTICVTFDGRRYDGLLGLENIGDRGDTYDFDPVPGDWMAGDVEIRRTTHPSGIQTLNIKRYFAVPILDEDRNTRTARNRYLEMRMHVRVAPGISRVDVAVSVTNEAIDHRLRLLFPTGARADRFTAATTLDVAERAPGKRDDEGWLHPAPTTFPSQGWVCANDLTVVAPGLAEAEVTEDGVIAITLLRSVGWLSRMDLKTRPNHAGPGLETPGAQCRRSFEARVALLQGEDPRAARDAELGLLAVAAGDAPLTGPDEALVTLEPRAVLLSALKPAEREDGFVVRVLNPTDDEHDAVVTFGFEVASARGVRLDEEPDDVTLKVSGRELRFAVPPHALRSVLCK
jgi:mannosylglycerate hydrolase